MSSQTGWRPLVALVAVAVVCPACRRGPSLGSWDAGLREASLWDVMVWDREPIGECVGYQTPDAAISRPEYDDTWCREDLPADMDPNAECIPGTDEYPSSRNAQSWGGGRWVARREDRGTEHPIVVYDLEDATSFVVSEPGSLPGSPKIDGTTLVYMDEVVPRTGQWAIHIYDLEERREVATVAFSGQMFMALKAFRGEYVVLGADYENSSEIRSLESNEATAISHEEMRGVWMADQYVSWVVGPWDVPNWTGKGVSYCDMETWETFPILMWSGVRNTCVDGHRIVWDDTRRSGAWPGWGWVAWDVYLYDIETGEERLLSDDPYDQLNPYIRGDLVVWEDWRFSRGQAEKGCANDIYVYDVSTGTGRRVTSTPWFWNVISPVYGGKVLARRYVAGTMWLRWQLCFFDLKAMGILDETGEHVVPE